MKHEEQWRKAKKLCRLSNEDIGMARELGMGPRSLIKNIPSPTQRWKAPVKIWIRELYEKRFGKKAQTPPSPPSPRPQPPVVGSLSRPPQGLAEPEFAEVLYDDCVSPPDDGEDDPHEIPF